jgi:type VI secretion system secreted protein VgrG
MNMANRVTGRGNPKNTVLKSITSKLQKIDAEMKNQAATIIKVGSKRQLTSGEIAMSRLIFKDAIDYSKVWIHLGGLIHTKTGNAMTPAGEIYLPKDDYLKHLTIAKLQVKTVIGLFMKWYMFGNIKWGHQLVGLG